MKVIILRDLFFDGKASLGTCYIFDGDNQVFKKDSLERGWLDNKNRVSCIPVGVYPLVLEHSPRFKKKLWEVKNVPGRSECKFHAANYWHQLNGCIALGNNRKYIDNDLVLDVTSSRDTMRKFHEVLSSETEVELHVMDILTLTKKSL